MSSATATPTGLETGVVTPLGDDREYKKIVISNNNLEVLLVSDKETSKCAACMSIGVGSTDDPEELDGLTHLLEHMVFCTSSKYPDEYSFPNMEENQMGPQKGVMVLTFEVYKEAFNDALDRFAQIFIGPIFSDEATIKEVNVVDKVTEAYCFERTSLQQICIWKSGVSSYKPNKKGFNITNELEEFYKKNFCASVMRLVIYSND